MTDEPTESFSYFYTLQQEARSRTVEALNTRALRSNSVQRWDKLTLCSILGTDLGNACQFARDEWPKYYTEETHKDFSIDWEALAYKRHEIDPDHFNLAIWQEVHGKQVLAALALGNPSHARRYLTIKWIERYFGYTPVGGRALLPILTCAEEYARLLGSEKVLIKDPVDPNKYERYGYQSFHHPDVPFGGNYMSKDV